VPSGRNQGHSRGSPTESQPRPIHVQFPYRCGAQAIDTTPTNTLRFSLSKKILLDHKILPEPLPMMSLEAKNGGAFLGAVFSKIFDPRYRLSPRPRGEGFEFLEPLSPDSLPTYPGERGSSRVVFHAIDAAGAPTSRARRTGMERRREFPLPHKDHPKKPPPDLDKIRELRTPSRRTPRPRRQGRHPAIGPGRAMSRRLV
jgi:hypothetical protein